MAQRAGAKTIERALAKQFGGNVHISDYRTKGGRIRRVRVYGPNGIMYTEGPGGERIKLDFRLNEAQWAEFQRKSNVELPGLGGQNFRQFRTSRAVFNMLYNVSEEGKQAQQRRAYANFRQALDFRYQEMSYDRKMLVDALYRELERNGNLGKFWRENYILIEEVFNYRDEKGGLLRGETYTDSNALADMLIERMSEYIDPSIYTNLIVQTGYNPIKFRQARMSDYGGGKR